MPVSNDRAMHNDCFDLFDLALTKKWGIQVVFDNYGSAKYFQLRLCKARELDRDMNTKMYQEGDPRYGRSEYYNFSVRVIADPLRPNKYLVRLERSDFGRLMVEDIPGSEDEVEDEIPEVPIPEADLDVPT